MKILHLYKDALPKSMGGVEKFIFELSRETTKYNCENVVLATSLNSENVIFDGMSVNYSSRNFSFLSTPISAGYFWKFRELKDNFDIIHLHYPYPFADLTLLANSTNLPVLITFHSEIIKQKISRIFYYPIERLTFKKAKAVVFSSENMLKRSGKKRTFHNYCEVIPLGIKAINESPDILKKSKLGQKPFILFVGVLRYYKGLNVLLEAAKHIKSEIVIIGDGPLRDQLEKRIKTENLQNVSLLGHVDEERKMRLLEDCRALVLPSTMPTEAFGMVILEAFSRGKPVITSELGTGTSEIVEHGINGLIVKPNDPIDLSHKIEKLMSNRKLAESYGKAAYLKFKSSFEIETVAKKYLKLYEKIKN